MKVAVVIPLFNGEDWIDDAIASVRMQRGVTTETVVVDDDSTDRSREIVQRYPDVILLTNPGKGAADARNTGAHHSTAPLIAFLDQDDVWHPHHLRCLAEILASDPRVPAAAARTVPGDRSRPPPFSAPVIRPVKLDPWKSFPINSVGSPSGVLLRREEFETSGGWNPAFPLTGDFHLWLRLAAANPLTLNDCATVAIRTHAESYSALARRRGALEYIDEQLESATDALANTTHRSRDGLAALRRRLTVLDAVRDVLTALDSSGDHPLTGAAHRFEKAVADDDVAFVNAACAQLLWYLEPVWTTEAAAGTLAALVARWPNAAPRTRLHIQRACERLVPWRTFLALVRARPADPRSWSLLVDVARMRAGRRLARYSASRLVNAPPDS